MVEHPDGLKNLDVQLWTRLGKDQLIMQAAAPLGLEG